MRLTISAISSAPTSVRSNLLPPSAAGLVSAACNCASSLGNCSYCSLAKSSHLPSRCNCAILILIWSICSLMPAEPCDTAFSAFHTSSKSENCFCKSSNSSCINSKRFLDASSSSFFSAASSIFNWMMRRLSLSMLSGMDSLSILIKDAASSIKSIALSGKKRSVM